MSEAGHWRGRLKAILRGLAAAIPVVGPAIAECLKHAEEAKLEAKVDALLRRVGRGDAGRTKTLGGMPEEDVERAITEGVSRLSEADRARLTSVFERIGHGAAGAQVHEAVDGALSALADAPPVRHTLLSYACQRAGEGRLLAPGDRIDARYEVIELIGVGGMGAVYRARDLELDEDVVVKFLRAELAGDAACARRFVQEAKVGLSLTHEGIVRIRDVRKTGETSYLTMEWVEGPTLRAFLGGGKKLSWGEAEPIAKGILSALAYAHAKGVLHLDLKPENVLLPQPDAPKLCDFGLARVAARPGGASLLPGAGTPNYMAPEQQRGGDLDARADVYAAGVLLYEMLAGEVPMGVFEPLDASVPAGVREAVQLALSQKREKRPKDAGELLKRISTEGTTARREEPRGGTVPAPATTASGGALRDAGLKYQGKNDQGYEEYEDVMMGMVLIRVPAGDFEMGSADCGPDAMPVHQVVLSEYLIGKYEVTNAQYRAFCRAKPHADPLQPAKGHAYEKYMTDSQYDDYPVVGVSWADAKAYCDWGGLRLPTEAEWEYAAKGKDGRKYPWGDEKPDETRANYDKMPDGGDYTRKVGSYSKGVSAFGALDMAGSVWEWCADWYGEKYYDECREGKQDPPGPPGGSYRVVRGGSWSDSDWLLRASDRLRYVPGSRYINYGFRVARSPAH